MLESADYQYWSVNMRFIFFMLLLAASWPTAASGQETFRVGDEVEFSCTRVSGGVCGGRVEAVNGNSVRVKWGNMRDQFTIVSRDQIRMVPKPPSQEQWLLWNAFEREVKQKSNAESYLKIFAHYYDAEEFPLVGRPGPEHLQELMKFMAEVDELCKGKYRGITNIGHTVRTGPPRKGDLINRYGDWCKIADQRLAFEPRLRANAANDRLNPTSDISDMNTAIGHSRNLVFDKTQILLYEPEKWKAKIAADLKPKFAEYGTSMSPDFFSDVDKKAAELRAVIDRTAPTRTFERPGNRDAAVEGIVKRKFAAEIPGVQIVDIGGSYPKWERRDGADLTGMGTGYKLYRLTVNYYKRGEALVKIPNRPYCQSRSWVVRQRGMAVSLDGGGEFVKCQ